MAQVTMFWHGGSSYAMFDTNSERDAERFPSLSAAIRSFGNRAHNQPHYPCVDECSPDDGGPTAWVFFGEVGEYPDRVISFGPRGGIRVERS